VIVLLEVDGQKVLFTGDAGVDAINGALDVLESEGFTAGELNFAQIPHHGSRHNVSPSLLDRLLGPKGRSNIGTACVSCPLENPSKKHPAKKALNAFTRRGYRVHQTAGVGKHHSHDAPDRDGWSSSTPIDLFGLVEDFDE
jgi:beta-lactamase superfamily II metal-dependent hydrolase